MKIIGKVPILSNGHGGVINKEYQCLAGGRQVLEHGNNFYEGEFNRSIVNRIGEQLAIEGVPYYVLVPELVDMTLDTRVRRANDIYDKDDRVYVLDIHSNAGGGKGFEIFTSIGQTMSDHIATYIGESIKNDSVLSRFRFREDLRDGDLDKERNFSILKKTKCPAALLEILFFDNPVERQQLLSLDFRNYVATVIAKAMISMYYG